MNILLNTLAIVAIILSGFAALITPFIIGMVRPAFRKQDAIANALEFVIVLLLALRVLGKI